MVGAGDMLAQAGILVLVANRQDQALLVKVLVLADHTKVLVLLLIRALALVGFRGLAVAVVMLRAQSPAVTSKKTRTANEKRNSTPRCKRI
jgi:hypothetical protein